MVMASVVFCGLAFRCALAMALHGGATPDYVKGNDLRLGLESGHAHVVSIYEGDKMGMPLEAFVHIGVEENGKLRLVRTMNDLRGVVRVSKPDDALRLVRFRTVAAAHLDGYYLEFEILTPDRARSFPTFDPKKIVRLTASGGAGLGVVSAAQLQRLRLANATVTHTGAVFTVDRWLVVQPAYYQAHRQLQHVRETVAPDGAYKRALVEQRAAPGVPGLNNTLRFVE